MVPLGAADIAAPTNATGCADWEAFWVRVIMCPNIGEDTVEVGRAAISQQQLEDYTQMLLANSPFSDGGRIVDNPSHMLWIMAMLEATVPNAHLGVVRRGLLAGEGARLADGSQRLGVFVSIANATAEHLGLAAALTFTCADDGSAVSVAQIRRPARRLTSRQEPVARFSS